MTFTFAQGLPVYEWCTLFNTAFSDYLLPMVLTQPVMEMKLKRDGMNPALSPVALAQDRPVGFIMNATGNWQGNTTAYNGGTGVVPQARGQALTQQLYHMAVPHLQQAGVTQCLLEVVQENTRAFHIYQKMGFEVIRELRCFRGEKAAVQWHAFMAVEKVQIRPVSTANWPLYQSFWEIEPSWQHHAAALGRSAAYVQFLEACVEDQCVGYGAIYPMTGAVAQIAVAPAWREKGIGQALLQALANHTTAPVISVINVDTRGKSLLQFLEARKVTEILPQYEMIWAL